MCTALYLAAATAPPLVPWVEAKPGLHVYAPDGGHESTRTQFTLPYVVQLGAYSGCACGFGYSSTPALSKQHRDEEEASHACLAALADYLDALIAVAGPVQLRMSYYAGDNRPADVHDGTSLLDREAGPTFAQIHVPTSCRHCEHPHCMKDCPPDAINRSASGEVFIADTCIGPCVHSKPRSRSINVPVPPTRRPGWMAVATCYVCARMSVDTMRSTS